MDCHSHCSPEVKPSAFVAQKAYGKVDTKGLAIFLSSGIPLTILDARSGAWDDGKRIGPALSLASDASAEQIAKIVPSKTALIVVYCSNQKCPAGSYLASRLLELGYSNILKYEEGIDEWIRAGNKAQVANN